eukprot:g1322.t1
MDSALANIQARYQVPSEAEDAYAEVVLRWLRGLLQRHPLERPDAHLLAAQVAEFLEKGAIHEESSILPARHSAHVSTQHYRRRPQSKKLFQKSQTGLGT